MNKKPVLTKNEKKNTIAGKKKSKIVLKNVLAQPFEKYWPELSVVDVDHFVEVFRMQYSLRPKTPTTTSATITDDNNVPREFDSNLKVGLQSSIRSISSGKALALFISTKIKPKHIVDQIIFMALTQNKNSKIFCLPNMDEALLNVLGFSCQCLTILKSENPTWNWILGKSKQFPVPRNYFQETWTKMEQMDVDCSESPAVVRLNVDQVDFNKLYLLKENPNERAFVPHGAVRKNLENRSDSSEFISLGSMNQNMNSTTNEVIRKMQRMGKSNVNAHLKFKKLPSSHTTNSKVNYVSLKINRVQPNPDKNRNKKKKKSKKCE